MLSRTLRLGSRGSDVTTLQNYLITQGYLTSGSATGFYGPLTQAAVQKYQSQKGIVSSGTPATTGYGAVGPKTTASIASCGSTTSTTTQSTTISTATTAVGSVTTSVSNTSSSTPAPTSPSGQSGSVASPNPLLATGMRFDGQVLPLYHAARAIGFENGNAMTSAFDQQGKIIWQKSLGSGSMFGGFDYDADGVPDFALVKVKPSANSCMGITVPINTSWLEVYSGATGAFLMSTTPTDDICFPDLGPTNVNQAWQPGTLYIGSSGTVIAAHDYPTQADDFIFQGLGVNPLDNVFVLPATSAYDSEYPNAKSSLGDPTHDYETRSYQPVGIIVNYAGINRYVFFTTRRVMQYAVAPLGPTQLIADHPFVARPDLVGRAYGMISADPQNSEHVAVVAGASALTVFVDMVGGSIGYDPWGGIERHVTIYDLASNTTDQTFYSYAHDDNDGWKYKNRIVFPTHYWLSTGSGYSRIGFNLFGTDGHWHFDITAPGTTAVASDNIDLFVWDIRDIDGDGVLDVIASPTGHTYTSGYGYYFPDWTTTVYSWNAATAHLDPKYTLTGIPYLTAGFMEANDFDGSASGGLMYPVLSGIENNMLGIYTQDKSGTVSLAPLK